MKGKRILLAFILCVTLVFGLVGCSTDSYTYTLNYANLKMSVGQEEQLRVTVDPGKEIEVSYESSDPAVASVSADGKVSAVANGSAVIAVRADDVTLVCSVSVVTVEYVWGLNYGAAILGVGAEIALVPFVSPAKEFACAYSSSDPSVASVSADGTVKGIAEGTAVITADAGGQTLECEVRVSAEASQYAYTATTEIYTLSLHDALPIYTLSDRALDLYETAEYRLSFAVFPEKETKVTFTSADPAVASVDADGTVTARSEGETEIYAEADGQRFVCRVNVRAMYVLNYKAAELRAGETLRLAVSNTIDGSVLSGVVFRSDNEAAATVDGSGCVTAVREGFAVIAAEVNGRTFECFVTVAAGSAEEGQEG